MKAVALTAALLFSPTAGVDHGIQAAKAHWDATPPCQVQIIYRDDPTTTAATATRVDHDDGRVDCWIAINVHPWDRLWLVSRCNVLVHEWGHLLGYSHTDDPNDVMHPDAPVRVEECEPVRRKGGPFKPQRLRRAPLRRAWTIHLMRKVAHRPLP